MPEFKEQKERKAMEQTVPQAWLLVISDLSAQRRDCSPSVILPRASEIIVMWGSGFCRIPGAQVVRLLSLLSPTLALPSCRRLCLLASYFFPSVLLFS